MIVNRIWWYNTITIGNGFDWVVYMATDIHVCVETFNKETKKWEYKTLYKKNDMGMFETAHILEARNSSLFSRLAGFGLEEPFVYPRGLPDDLSDETKLRHGSGNWFFDETWYDYCELSLYADTDKAFTEELEYDVGSDEYVVVDKCNVVRPFVDKIDLILEAYDIYCPKPGEVRIIMWFDC